MQRNRGWFSGSLCALRPPAILCSERTCCNLPWQPRFHHQGQLPLFAFLVKPKKKKKKSVSSPLTRQNRNTHARIHTAVLTLLCLRRHFADTWGNIKPRLSVVLIGFSLPGVVFPSVVKKWLCPLAAQARLDCTTLHDGFIRCGVLAVLRSLLRSLNGNKGRACFVNRFYICFLRWWWGFCSLVAEMGGDIYVTHHTFPNGLIRLWQIVIQEFRQPCLSWL